MAKYLEVGDRVGWNATYLRMINMFECNIPELMERRGTVVSVGITRATSAAGSSAHDLRRESGIYEDVVRVKWDEGMEYWVDVHAVGRRIYKPERDRWEQEAS